MEAAADGIPHECSVFRWIFVPEISPAESDVVADRLHGERFWRASADASDTCFPVPIPDDREALGPVTDAQAHRYSVSRTTIERMCAA